MTASRQRKVSRQKAEQRRVSGEVFLEYHEHSSWAHDKLASGTVSLTPEEVAFMRREIARRKDVAGYLKELADHNAAVDIAAKLAVNAQ